MKIRYIKKYKTIGKDLVSMTPGSKDIIFITV